MFARFSGGPPIFVWGASGAGKSEMLLYLGGAQTAATQTRTLDAKPKHLK
jgi:ABC-type lipoprotein export system ATPase subunit